MTWRILIGALLALFTGSASAEPISAILSVATMVGAAGGAAGFSLATAFSSLASGLAFTGGALSLLGNVTGNKTLTKLGVVAGVAGLGTALFNATGAAATGAAATDAAGAGQLAETAGSAPLAESAGAAGAGAAGAEAAGGGLIDAAGSGIAPSTAPSAFATAAPDAFPGSMPSDAGFAPGGAPPAGAAPAAQVGSGGGGGGLVDSVGKGLDWLNKNKGVAQIGAGLIQGAATAYGQMSAQDAEMGYYDRLRRKFSDSITGMQGGGLQINPHATVTSVDVQNPTRYTSAPARPVPQAQAPARPEIVRST